MSEEMAAAEVAVQESKPPAPVQVFDGASEGITTFLADLQVAYQIAVRLVATSFVPQSYQNKPQEAAAAIVAGQGVGLGPMESLRSIDIIQGTPAMRAITLRALVVSQGHEIWVEESTPTRAVVCGRRAGSDKVQRSEWELDRARALGLLNKDNWKKQPQAMLIARATSECARLVAPDVLLGIPYSTEELQDLDGAPSAAPAKKPRGGVQTLASRARAAEAQQEAAKSAPDEASAPDAPEVVEDAADDATAPQDSDTELFPCVRCGAHAVEDEAGLCESCEAEVEAEISAGSEQE